MFYGSIVAIATPFANGKVDTQALKKLVEFQIAGGTHAIVSCGTTGESPTLTHEEDVLVTNIVVSTVNKRVPVIAGAGSNSYEESRFLAESAKKNGADGILVVTPYYNKPTQEGMYKHYKKLAESVDIPIILYNVPGRTGVILEVDTVVRLAQIPNIVAIKDATGVVDNAMRILAKCPDFTVLSGDDSLTLPMAVLGAKGVISVAANVVPDKMSKMCEFLLKGSYKEASQLHYKMLDLFNALFIEPNPIPVKYALYMMGIIEDELRLPLLSLTEPNKKLLKKSLENLQINIVNN